MAALVPEEQGLRLKEGSLFALADGLGGLPAGDVASREVIGAVTSLWEDKPPFKNSTSIKNFFNQVNEHLYLMNVHKTSTERMGSTLTVSYFLDDHLWIGHVGDCRMYRVRGQDMRCLTIDQSSADHVLTQAMGVTGYVEADVYEETLEPGDVYCQCSDGLYGALASKDIYALLHTLDPKSACEKLIALTNQRGADDNITVQIIHILKAAG